MKRRDYMQAVAVLPKQKNSVHLKQVVEPKIEEYEVLVRVLQVGIDGTDMEINAGLYGEAPENEDFLIIGHEAIGVVEKAGEAVEGFQEGDYVVATVRRPDNCLNCTAGEYDMCLTGNYKERGIKGLHGFMAEYYKEVPEYLVKIPEKFRDVGVLLEPLSIVEKAIYQVFEIQKRMCWEPEVALVLGAGPIGLLATMILRSKGLNTFTFAKSEKTSAKAKVVEKTGSVYINATQHPIHTLPSKLGNIDIIIEATGNANIAFQAMNILGINGILALTSITGGNGKLEIDPELMNLSIVLGNKVIFGTVNANKKYFEMGIAQFARWQKLMREMITRRITIENFKAALKREEGDIKTVIEFE
jgi:threonine dehydrogenase-like Zn-dependent dehydrogenase